MRAATPHTEGLIDRDGISISHEVCGSGQRTIFLPTRANPPVREFCARHLDTWLPIPTDGSMGKTA